MKVFSQIGIILGMAVLISIAMPVFAESAPVYDADAVEQQFNNNYDQGSDLPPPPPPGQEGSFVQSQAAPSQALAVQGQVASPSSDQPPTLSMDQRLQRMEQQINNMQNSDLTVRLNALQGEVQSLRGQLEQLIHELQQVQNQQKSMYSDLDKRLSQNANQNSVTPADSQSSAALPNDAASSNTNDDHSLAATSTVFTKPGRKNAQTVKAQTDSVDGIRGQPNVAEEQLIYQTAYNLIKAKKYNEAVNSLQGMLKKYPSGQFASNAHYWLGELYGLMGKNDKALTEFNAVVKTYPRSPRVSDAQLKVGLIYASQFNWPGAKAAFRKVINRFPGTSSARLASEQLKQIRQAGH